MSIFVSFWRRSVHIPTGRVRYFMKKNFRLLLAEISSYRNTRKTIKRQLSIFVSFWRRSVHINLWGYQLSSLYGHFRLLLAEISSYPWFDLFFGLAVSLIFVSFWRRSVHINLKSKTIFLVKIFVSFWRRSVHINSRSSNYKPRNNIFVSFWRRSVHIVKRY